MAHSSNMGSMYDKYARKDQRSRRTRVASYVMLALLASATVVVVYLALTK